MADASTQLVLLPYSQSAAQTRARLALLTGSVASFCAANAIHAVSRGTLGVCSALVAVVQDASTAVERLPLRTLASAELATEATIGRTVLRTTAVPASPIRLATARGTLRVGRAAVTILDHTLVAVKHFADSTLAIPRRAANGPLCSAVSLATGTIARDACLAHRALLAL